MANLLIGYDVERWNDPAVTREFLSAAADLHQELDAPATFFVLGKVAEVCAAELDAARQAAPIDLQQHTYSHLLLKTILVQPPDAPAELRRGGSLDEIEEEVARASAVMRERLGVQPLGLTGPWCYYRGLADRPDILDVLHRQGIRFCRTWGRNERDWQPVDFAVQPFFYTLQGFPDLLECPIQGWQDVIWRGKYGWANLSAYEAELKRCVDYCAEHDLDWGYCAHDWSAIRHDPGMSVMGGLIAYARTKGMRIITYRQYYEEKLLAAPRGGPGQ